MPDERKFDVTLDGGLVDVVGDEQFNQTIRMDTFGNTIPAPELEYSHSFLICKALDAVKMQIAQTDQGDWLYQKLLGILMELRDTASIIKLRSDENLN